MDNKINNLIEQMTLEEKVSLTSGGSDWSTQPIERLGIPEIFITDGPHGVRWMDPEKSGEMASEYGMIMWTEMDPEKGLIDLLFPATCFPTLATTASSWDRELLSEIGRALGKECIHFGIDILLAPGTNIKRHPLTGRNFEYFSEDPCLAGEMAAAYIKGVQREGVGTSVKHFACNNAEFERLSMSSDVDERALREIYLNVFERVIKKAKPWTVMSSYNRINGVDASHNKFLLTQVLKEEWGFDGIVISDWWAVRNRVQAAAAGLDLEMPANLAANERLLQAVQSGILEEAVVDELVRRILRLVYKCVAAERDSSPVDFDAHDELARRAAAESAVLLKNDGEILPIIASEKQRIAVIGRMANKPRYQGVGSSLVNPTKLSNALEAIKVKVSGDELIQFAEGYDSSGEMDDALIQEAVQTAANADIAIIFAGLPIEFEMESWDRPHMDIPQVHIRLIEEIAQVQKNSIVVLSNGSCVKLKPWIDAIPAVLEAWLGGQAGGLGIADVLFGDVNPCGKLAVTLPKRLEDTPAYLHFPGENGHHLYGEGIFVGYRYYDRREIEPHYPFGFGLSYTDFTYSDLHVDQPVFNEQATVTISCKVTNTGSRYGKEIVQLYVSDHDARLARPPQELKGFEKIVLMPGETEQVTFQLTSRDFAYYDPAQSKWVAESGKFDILIGRSSREICLNETVELKNSQSNLIPLTRGSYIKDFLDDPAAKIVFVDFLIRHNLISPDTPAETIDGLRNIFVPIEKTLEMFSRGAITDKKLDELLDKINFIKDKN